MTHRHRFRICYVGGGSRFVITLLHGLADHTDALRSLSVPLELVLFDPALDRCADNATYVKIVAAEKQLPLHVLTTADRESALRGADWVLFSAGLMDKVYEWLQRLPPPQGRWLPEAGPWTAIEAAVIWPLLRDLCEQIKRLAPHAVFTTLVNPTDVLARAVSRRFGLRACGMCVEVPNLHGFLAYFLQTPLPQLRLQYIGANHVGYVTRCEAAGQDGASLLRQRLDPLVARDDWHPMTLDFADCLRATGYMRTSPYHLFPFETRDWGQMRPTLTEWGKRRLPGYESLTDYHQANLRQALAAQRMIPSFNPVTTHPHATPYNYPDTAATLGALVLGLAGGRAPQPVPLQVQAGNANPCVPGDAWVEVPTRVTAEAFEAQPVPQPPDWLFAHTAAIVRQRVLLADWLATGDPDPLRQALFLLPDGASIQAVMELVEKLHQVAAG